MNDFRSYFRQLNSPFLLHSVYYEKKESMIIAGNWKMNLDRGEALQLVKSIANEDISSSIDVRMAVPALYLPILNELVEGHSNISIGAQNIHQEESGAYTGEISARMLVSCGINWTILGHSERRELFGETDEDVRAKCERALGEGLGVIVCVGEPESVRELEEHENFVKSQIMNSLPKKLSESEMSRVTIAYEPVWAIGTGLTASPEQAQSMHSFIRSELKGRFGKAGSELPILYGGSMKPGNASDLLSQHDIDGGLIGGASLQTDSFLKIIRQAEKQKK